MIGILVFINKQIFESFLIFCKYLRKIPEKDIGVQQKIVKIHCAGPFTTYTIGLVYFTKLGPSCYLVMH